jgi:hypothetical protein
MSDFWQSAVGMFLRSNNGKKDGKDHGYFSIVENHRLASGKTVQRTVVYLGEINDEQQAAWPKTLSVFDQEQQEYSNVSRGPRDSGRCGGPPVGEAQQTRTAAASGLRELLVGCELWQQLGLDQFWDTRLAGSREDVAGEKVLQLAGGESTVGSRQRTAMDALLGTYFAVAEKDRLYLCLDRVLEHKQELFLWLRQKWADLFHADFEAGGT